MDEVTVDNGNFLAFTLPQQRIAVEENSGNLEITVFANDHRITITKTANSVALVSCPMLTKFPR
jgi:hypothetical protein